MLDRLFNFLAHAPAGEPLPEADARVAIAAILVAAARSDGEYDLSERAHIDRILAQRFDLPPSEAEALRAEGERTDETASDLVRFTRAVKVSVPHEERAKVLEAVWEIAYADGERSHEEDALVRRLAGLLYIEDKDAGLARKRVEARLGIS